MGFQPDKEALTPVTVATQREGAESDEVAGRSVGALRATNEGKIVGKMNLGGETYLPKRESWCPVVTQPVPMYFQCSFDKEKFDPVKDRVAYQNIGNICFAHGTQNRSKLSMTGAGYANLDTDNFYYANPRLSELKSQGKIGLEQYGYAIELSTEKDFEKVKTLLAQNLNMGTCEQAYIRITTKHKSAPLYPGGIPVESQTYTHLRLFPDGHTEVIRN
jgi:hypothetical protein